MQPELALAHTPSPSEAVPQAWRGPLLRLALAWAALVALFSGEWAEMARQWWDSSTYNHILLIPAILAWLVRLRWPELSRLSPHAWWPGLALLGGIALAWLPARAIDFDLGSQLAAVAMLLAAVPALLGPRVAAGLLFPLGYMLFLVPFGDELVPTLQAITAELAIALTHASGVPARIDGVFIDTPVGLFEVAEACSGVKFLVAMVALGALVAHTGFTSAGRRAAFMAAAVLLSVIGNGVRAWGTIYIAQSQGIAFAAGFDHIVYGWVFFAVLMAALLALAWRFFDRAPDDPLLDAAALEASQRLGAWAQWRIAGWAALATILLITAAAAGLQPLLAAALAHS